MAQATEKRFKDDVKVGKIQEDKTSFSEKYYKNALEGKYFTAQIIGIPTSFDEIRLNAKDFRNDM